MSYMHPGVYIEEIPSGLKPISGVATSVAAFIGFTAKGPLNEPARIGNWGDYASEFGGIRDTGKEPDGDPMGHTVAAFFQNGGANAYIVRIAHDDAVKADGYIDHPNPTDPDPTKPIAFKFSAINKGEWGNGLVVVLSPTEVDPNLYTVEIGRKDDEGAFSALETFNNVSMVDTDPQYIEGVLNGASELVDVMSTTVSDITSDSGSGQVLETTLGAGDDGTAPVLADYQTVFTTLVKYRDITMLSLPGKAWDADGKPALSAAIAHAEKMKNCLVFIDPPASKELESAVDVAALGLPTSTYTVLYYPWVKVANPHFDAERNPGVPRTVLVSPSGFAAGMWSKIDGRRGVWKAPAGVETSLLGLADLEYRITDGDQDQLNPLGVNCLRALPNYGAVIWGARTLATNANPEWRYVPVRRTAIMIEQSTYEGLQWVVFEPNDQRLWSSLRLNIESFMGGLFRAGAFQGEKASDAYFVRCGLGDTMTQGDIDRGQVIVVIGFAPLKPAEFVIIRIQQKLGKQ